VFSSRRDARSRAWKPQVTRSRAAIASSPTTCGTSVARAGSAVAYYEHSRFAGHLGSARDARRALSRRRIAIASPSPSRDGRRLVLIAPACPGSVHAGTGADLRHRGRRAALRHAGGSRIIHACLGGRTAPHAGAVDRTVWSLARDRAAQPLSVAWRRARPPASGAWPRCERPRSSSRRLDCEDVHSSEASLSAADGARRVVLPESPQPAWKLPPRQRLILDSFARERTVVSSGSGGASLRRVPRPALAERQARARQCSRHDGIVTRAVDDVAAPGTQYRDPLRPAGYGRSSPPAAPSRNSTTSRTCSALRRHQVNLVGSSPAPRCARLRARPSRAGALADPRRPWSAAWP